ncbi:peptide-methionine (S)-S-oxide reductase MsrA [Maribacter chungangensis]|uniref:Peptide methionine sulfoxide reductase MsrA n=1 Tax=Maribacter chungangensis TaxID=1069117 RepID=A0ABW3B7N7_9FLAO
MGVPTNEIATLGGGCFWCTEAIFQEVKGVSKVLSGYTGGTVPGRPTYREICSGLTGHAEVVKITYDPAVISFAELLLIFMTTHDPTTLNRKGADVGTQYRSVIYCRNKEQEYIAKAVVKEISAYYKDPVVTEISPIGTFYESGQDHQDYYKNNPEQAYCKVVIHPKLKALRKLHANKIRN